MSTWLKSIIPIATILLSYAPSLLANWIEILPPLFVMSSDAIVIGKLDSDSEVTRDGRDSSPGTLRVSRVLHGKAKPGNTLTLRWDNITGHSSPRKTREMLCGQPALWFLTKSKGRTYAADYPSRAYALDNKRDLEDLQIELQEAISRGATDQRFKVVDNFLQEFLYPTAKGKQ